MSYVQNYMVVDGVLRDLVEDFASYIDKVSPPAEGQASFCSFVEERLAEDASEEQTAQQEEIFKAIAERSAVLSSGPEREFEPQYNLVLHILTFSSDLTAILPIVLKNLLTPPTYPNGANLCLIILTNLFNILPVSSPLRYQVFLAILDSAAATNNLSLVVSQSKHLPTWLKEWEISEDASREVYAKISTLLTSANDSQTAYKYLLSAVSSGASSLASQLALISIGAESIYDFDELFALEAIQTLKQTDASLFALLEIVATGDYPAFKKLDLSTLSKHNLSTENLERKVRIVSLAKAASQSSTRTISYAVLAEAVETPVDQVEVWIIDAIRAGLVEGRLSQMTQSFALHRATPVGNFGVDEWKIVASKLAGWKSGLKDIADVLKNARENAEKDEEKAARSKAQPVLVASK